MKHELYEKRLAKDSRLGHVELVLEDTLTDFGARIVRRRNCWGITDVRGIYLLPPVFDSIQEVVPNSGLILATIVQDRMLYDLQTRSTLTQLTPEIETKCFLEPGSVELYAGGKYGLWSIKEKRLLIPIAFDEVCRDSRSRFLWVRNENEFDYIRASDGRKMGLQNIIEVYDSLSAMFIEQEGGVVKMLNSEGYEDDLGLRRLVKNHQGRLKLMNIQHAISATIDIYGLILKKII